MAFGHAVMRGGFSGDDDKIKGTKGDVDETRDGGVGDDVIIMFDGDDQAVGGNGEDDLSGGGGDDLLVGAIWTDDDGDPNTSLETEGNGVVDAEDTFEQDDFSDDYNAEATLSENGEDTIWYYDDDDEAGTDATEGVVDFIDLSEAVEFVDTDGLDGITEDEMETQLNNAFSYQDGQLTDADDTENVWFNVYTDAGETAADTVYVEVDGNQFEWDGSGWELMA